VARVYEGGGVDEGIRVLHSGAVLFHVHKQPFPQGETHV
jgi:hypothetical protein